jgi:cystathionine beta-lyase
MAKYDFDTLPNRRGTNAAKWDVFDDQDILPLWVADMDFQSPPEVLQALQERVEHGVFGYPYYKEDAKQTIVDWVADRHQWEITPEDVIFIPGVVAGFNLASHAVAQPGDGVLLQTPAYGPFLRVAKNVNLVQQEMELTQDEEGQYTVDLDLFEETITEKTRIFMFCNPQNPTGRVFTKDEIEGMAEICLRHGVTICSDEIHSDLVFSGHKHIPTASLGEEIADNTITLIAPSKTFNIAGLEASVAIITNPELRQKFEGSRQGLIGWVNYLGMTALLAAYREGAPWLDALLQYLEANRELTYDFVNNQLPGVKMAKPEGTYLAWLDCRALEVPDDPDAHFNKFFLEKAGVALNAGDWFGKSGRGFARLNFASPRSMLEEGLGRMKSAVEAR